MAKKPPVVRRRPRLPALPKATEPYRYPGVGKNAPREVQKAIERFRKLPAFIRAQLPLLYWLLGDGTPVYKFRKSEVAYGAPQVEGQRCGNCNSLYLHPVTGTYICDRMRGVVELGAWCRAWNPPKAPGVYRDYQERGN